MSICAKDAADMDSMTTLNSIVRMKRICIVSPLARSYVACPVSLCGCGLRGLKGTISGRNVLKAHLAPNGSDGNFLISEMSKSVQKSSLRASVLRLLPFALLRADFLPCVVFLAGH